ncbi:MAG: dienelactone hydrolase family protein, partial [Bryobacteraceae bacterium]
MSEHITLTAADGHKLDAYVAHPEDEPIAGLVIVQEIFGVNAHIRSVADGYAKDGFLAVAPALFDRIRPGIELGYDGADMQTAIGLAPKLNPEKSLEDVAAALDFAASATGKKTGVVGYCFGGTLAWLAATRLHPAAAVGYYGGRIANYAAETPSAPVLLHFGKQDAHIPADAVEKVHAAHPEVE